MHVPEHRCVYRDAIERIVEGNRHDPDPSWSCDVAREAVEAAKAEPSTTRGAVSADPEQVGDCACAPEWRKPKPNGTCANCGGWLPGERPAPLPWTQNEQLRARVEQLEGTLLSIASGHPNPQRAAREQLLRNARS